MRMGQGSKRRVASSSRETWPARNLQLARFVLACPQSTAAVVPIWLPRPPALLHATQSFIHDILFLSCCQRSVQPQCVAVDVAVAVTVIIVVVA